MSRLPIETPSLESILSKYQILINHAISKQIPAFGSKTLLRDAIEYALLSEGKRFRPAIVLMLAEALGTSLPTEAALAIEYFHTSSLIADDLPCMDNDTSRRGIPALHIAYGQSTALLASYALISAGYQKIGEASRKFSNVDQICQLALENASENTGILGATGGQYLDLFIDIPTEKNVMEVIEKKTGTLFEVSFVFGWLFGGGETSFLPRVKKLARHFGRSFQVLDDFLDLTQDQEKKCPINYPLIAGKQKALQVLELELEALFQGLEELKLNDCALFELAFWLKTQTTKLPLNQQFLL